MEYYTKNEIALLLRVHPRTVERWLKDGGLKGNKLGSSKTSLWRINKGEVKRFLKKNS